MNTPEPPQTPDAEPTASATQLPSGQSQTGVVRRPVAAQDDGPVLEHSIEVPETEAETVTAAPAAPAPVAPPVVSAAPLRTLSALQESPKVSIPERMNHLTTENQRVRDELLALEKSLKLKAE